MKEAMSAIKTLTALKPQNVSGQSVDIAGYVIDKAYFESCVFSFLFGETSGTPTNFSTTFRVQDSADGSTFADVVGATFTVFSGQVATGPRPMQLSGEIGLDLKGRNRYLRLVARNSFLAGSSPNIALGAVCILGESKVMPV